MLSALKKLSLTAFMVLAARLNTLAADTAEVVPVSSSSSVVMSIIRMLGALAIVFALFFGAVWVMRNWQRFLAKRGVAAKLSVVEAKSLGPRQTLYVIGYERQRLLIASSPAGISMLSQLPEAPKEDPSPQSKSPAAPAFAEILQKVLSSK